MKKTIFATLAALFIMIPAMLLVVPTISGDLAPFDGKTQSSVMELK